MTIIAITTNKERTLKNIRHNYDHLNIIPRYSTDFIELDNPKMDSSLSEIVDQAIDKIVQIRKEFMGSKVNRPVIVDVDNPAIEAYLVVKLVNDIFINPSEKILNMPIFTVDIMVAPTENDLVVID